jgi:hypothetical protein
MLKELHRSADLWSRTCEMKRYQDCIQKLPEMSLGYLSSECEPRLCASQCYLCLEGSSRAKERPGCGQYQLQTQYYCTLRVSKNTISNLGAHRCSFKRLSSISRPCTRLSSKQLFTKDRIRVARIARPLHFLLLFPTLSISSQI